MEYEISLSECASKLLEAQDILVNYIKCMMADRIGLTEGGVAELASLMKNVDLWMGRMHTAASEGRYRASTII